jgi:cytochrome P450
MTSGNVDRTTSRDLVLSDGTFLPKGAFISAAIGPIMRDKEVFGEDADKFNGFRFSDQRTRDGENSKHQIVQISPEFLPFGMGNRAW